MKKFILGAALFALISYDATAGISPGKISSASRKIENVRMSGGSSSALGKFENVSEKITNLREAFEAVYKNNPSWLKMRSEKQVADESLTQAKIMFLPNVEGSVGVSRSGNYKNYDSHTNWQTSQQFLTTTDHKISDKTTSKSLGIRVSQNLFNGFASINRLEHAGNNVKAAYHKLKANETQLLIKTLEAYLNVWAGRKKLEAYIKKENNLKETLSAKRSSLTVGMGTNSEVAQADSNYQKAIYERIAAETELANFKAAFQKLTGEEPADNIDLPNLKLKLPASLDELVGKISALNHAILYYSFAAKAAEDELKIAKGALAPSCDLSLQANRYLTRKNSTSPTGTDENFAASLEVKIPIFSNSHTNGNTYSQIHIRNEQLRQAQCDLRDNLTEVTRSSVENWNTYIAAGAMIESSLSAVKSAEIASESDTEESQLGLKSNTDVLVKENQLLDSKIDLVNAKRKRILAMVQLYALINDLVVDKIFEGAEMHPQDDFEIALQKRRHLKRKHLELRKAINNEKKTKMRTSAEN